MTMTTYRTADGSEYVAETEAKLVRALHKASRSQAEDDKKFMQQVARRTFRQCRARVRTSSARAFVTDLVAAGVVFREGE